MENNNGPLCPQCGEIMHPRTAFVAPDMLEEFEWICKNCGRFYKKADLKESTEIDGSLKTDKNPT